ncbi:AraC-type DNA-binding protein [Chryseobacterium ureilyticum]|uniref:AraC-type DNA-binding protein n=1 Tax=Chryseobacterium ureilyticum TaxID=373668 RepID=A0A1N7MZ23_9FLAO|nr:AraC family transcriptional regulator [Chryseobacterium ureilyticum]SIS91366.1 AraC-type DNA-binding protein [Chryseobacterium ureilyticum]
MGETVPENTIARQILDFFGENHRGSVPEIFINELGKFETLTLYEGDEFLVKEYQFSYAEDYTMKFRTEAVKYIELAFFLDGAEVIQDLVGEKKGEYKLFHHYIYFTPENADVEIYFQKETSYKNLDIYVSKDYFHQLAGSNTTLQNFINKIDQNTAASLFPEGLPITPQMMSILLEIKKCNLEGFYRDYFIKSKILNLLFLIFEFTKSTQNETVTKSRLSINTYEVHQLMEVKKFIEDNLKSFYTIEQLSIKFGINEFKLKNGFKELFGDGVFHYASKLRMKEALYLLKNSDFSIKEIAYHLGYASPSSFSVAFKNELGMGPSYYRKN